MYYVSFNLKLVHEYMNSMNKQKIGYEKNINLIGKFFISGLVI